MKRVLALLFLAQISYGASMKDVDTAIANLSTAVDLDQEQGIAIIDAIQTVIASTQSLTVGAVSAKRNTTVDLVIHYKANLAVPYTEVSNATGTVVHLVNATDLVSAIQFDLVLPAGLTVESVAPGLAAQAAVKSAQGNTVTPGYRVVIFGLNQTVIPSGPLAVLKLKVGSSFATGKTILSLTNVSASNPSGNSVNLTLRNGSVTVR